MFQSSISSIKPDSLDWQIDRIILTSTFTYSRTASTFSFDSITHQVLCKSLELSRISLYFTYKNQFSRAILLSSSQYFVYT